jgi:colanic acid/amylovoran biosynthesis glycosyltransferase
MDGLDPHGISARKPNPQTERLLSTANRQPGLAHGRRRPAGFVERGVASATLSNLNIWPKAVPQRAVVGRPVGPIGYVIDRLPHSSTCFVRDEILELGRYGVRIHVFVLEPEGDSGGDPWIEGVAPTLSRIPASAFLGEAGVARSPGRTLRAQAAWIAREVTARGIDHLHAIQLAAADVAREVRRMMGVRFSFAAAGSEIYHDVRDPRTLRHKMTEAEFVVVPSEVSRQQLLGAIGAGANQNIHRIYRGVDLGTFRYGADPFHDSSSVLTVCPLVEDSGVADLIEALAILRDRRPEGIRATIVGDGELEADLRARIATLRLGDCVTMLNGPVDSPRLLSLMRSHAVMALPYTVLPGGGRDGVPPVVLEAMAVGLPVISTSVVGVSEVLEDGWTGRLVSPNDPKWLAGAVETLLDNVRLRTRMATDARAQVESYFGLSRNVARLARLFASAPAERTIAT